MLITNNAYSQRVIRELFVSQNNFAKHRCIKHVLHKLLNKFTSLQHLHSYWSRNLPPMISLFVTDLIQVWTNIIIYSNNIKTKSRQNNNNSHYKVNISRTKYGWVNFMEKQETWKKLHRSPEAAYFTVLVALLRGWQNTVITFRSLS